MMTRLTGMFVALTMAVVLTSRTASAQVGAKAAPGVAGTWTMAVDAGPHGATTMGLVLKQAGRKVSGSFASPHGDVPVEGEFTDGSLTLATVSSGPDVPDVSFTARLKDNGTLAGYMSSAMGDMTWTAERVKGSK